MEGERIKDLSRDEGGDRAHAHPPKIRSYKSLPWRGLGPEPPAPPTSTEVRVAAARRGRNGMGRMYVFEIVIALLLAGAGLVLVPGTPALVLDPELALTLFVA